MCLLGLPKILLAWTEVSLSTDWISTLRSSRESKS
jgi:hypothetical protein